MLDIGLMQTFLFSTPIFGGKDPKWKSCKNIILTLLLLLLQNYYNQLIEQSFDICNAKWLIRWGSFGSPDGIHKDVIMPRVYEMALRTWSEWLEVNINRNKTQLFFVSMSPTHQRYTRYIHPLNSWTQLSWNKINNCQVKMKWNYLLSTIYINTF